MKCSQRPEGKSVSQFLFDKASEYKETVRKDRELLRASQELKLVIRAERENLIPVWTGEVSAVDEDGGRIENFDDDSITYDNWKINCGSNRNIYKGSNSISNGW